MHALLFVGVQTAGRPPRVAQHERAGQGAREGEGSVQGRFVMTAVHPPCHSCSSATIIPMHVDHVSGRRYVVAGSMSDLFRTDNDLTI